jgi:hypothetical protein
MPRIKYEDHKFSPAKLSKIHKANEIIDEYTAMGLSLTLRQLYYQFVARGLIANDDKEYDKLSNTITDGRMAGLIDWEAIIDRTRFARQNSHWESPESIVHTCAKQFQFDKWENQPEYLEVWVEKDALIGVLETVCKENDVPYMACRGYASVSEIWKAGRERMRPHLQLDKQVTVLYLGDHDPSGVDMTRDVQDRLRIFSACDSPLQVNIERLALNMDQINLYNPPPNPAKLSDTRSKEYIRQFGDESWELDALDPIVIRDLIQNAIEQHRDDELWQQAVRRERDAREDLARVADNWSDVLDSL